MVSKPAGIRTVLSNIPNHTGHDGGSPRRYFKLGRFTMGNSDGFQFSHGLEYAQQLLYPMPTVWELLAYDVKDGASCLFQEIINVPDLTQLQPWDRTPQTVFLHSEASPSGAYGLTTGFTYTVPVGRKLWVSSARASVRRSIAASVGTYVNAQILVGSGKLVNLYAWGNTVGQVAEDSSPPGGLVLPPSSVITAQHFSTNTGGEVFVLMTLSGFLFDA